MSRPLTRGEATLAASVFGESIDYDRVRISTRRWGYAAICFGSHITFPPTRPAPADLSREPLEARAWLVHELTHVWQFQTAPLRTLASWAATLVAGGYGRGLPGYRYVLPLKRWGAYNLEQQAAMVEHAYTLREGGRCVGAPWSASLIDYKGCVPFPAVCRPG